MSEAIESPKGGGGGDDLSALASVKMTLLHPPDEEEMKGLASPSSAHPEADGVAPSDASSDASSEDGSGNKPNLKRDGSTRSKRSMSKKNLSVNTSRSPSPSAAPSPLARAPSSRRVPHSPSQRSVSPVARTRSSASLSGSRSPVLARSPSQAVVGGKKKLPGWIVELGRGQVEVFDNPAEDVRGRSGKIDSGEPISITVLSCNIKGDVERLKPSQYSVNMHVKIDCDTEGHAEWPDQDNSGTFQIMLDSRSFQPAYYIQIKADPRSNYWKLSRMWLGRTGMIDVKGWFKDPFLEYGRRHNIRIHVKTKGSRDANGRGTVFVSVTCDSRTIFHNVEIATDATSGGAETAQLGIGVCKAAIQWDGFAISVLSLKALQVPDFLPSDPTPPAVRRVE